MPETSSSFSPLSFIAGLFRSGISLDCNTILVNQEFRTNDPDIYAVGSFVKITTPINYQHTYTSAEETAAKVGCSHTSVTFRSQ